MRLILDGNEITYEPSFRDFEVVILNVFDVMIKAVGVIPRVETKLYSEWVSVVHHLFCPSLQPSSCVSVFCDVVARQVEAVPRSDHHGRHRGGSQGEHEAVVGGGEQETGGACAALRQIRLPHQPPGAHVNND